MSIRRHLVVVYVAGLLLGGLVACQSNPGAVAPTATPAATALATAEATPEATPEGATAAPELADILTILARAEGLEEFTVVAEQVGLTAELSGDGPFTVLVAPNTAFADLPKAVREDPELMAAILREQIIAGKYLLDEMSAPAAVTTLQGNELSLLVGQSGGTIFGANVLSGDFEAKNGIIHIVDTVILPPAIEAEVLALYEPIAGEVLQPMQGNIHIGNNETTPIAYRSIPPTSGPHYPNIAPWQVFEEPWRYEQLIHNLEDAGIVIYYQCDDGCPELLQQLRDLAQPLIDASRHIIVVPNDPSWTLPDGANPHQDMGVPIVVTAWRRALKLDAFDADRINAFIDAFEGIDHHVK